MYSLVSQQIVTSKQEVTVFFKLLTNQVKEQIGLVHVYFIWDARLFFVKYTQLQTHYIPNCHLLKQMINLFNGDLYCSNFRYL
jgi:outer membrane receptor for Fe3+-dicitrate